LFLLQIKNHGTQMQIILQTQLLLFILVVVSDDRVSGKTFRCDLQANNFK